jgi:hypothetical protein
VNISGPVLLIVVFCAILAIVMISPFLALIFAIIAGVFDAADS